MAATGGSSLAAAYAGGDFGRAVQSYAVSDSAFDSYFANGHLWLVEGDPSRRAPTTACS